MILKDVHSYNTQSEAWKRTNVRDKNAEYKFIRNINWSESNYRDNNKIKLYYN